MKKLMVVLMYVVGSASLIAGPNAEMQVAVVMKGDLVKVIYDGDKPCSVGVTISDVDGNLVFTESIRGSGFIRPYNFSNLPEGKYVIQVDDAKTTFEKTVVYEEKPWIAQLTRLEDAEEESQRFLVAVPGQNDSYPLVSVYSRYGKLMFTDKGPHDKDFARIYSLRDLNGGYIRVSNMESGEGKSLTVE